MKQLPTLSELLKNIWTDSRTGTAVYIVDIRSISSDDYNNAYNQMSLFRKKQVDEMKIYDDKKRTIAGEMIVKEIISDMFQINSDEMCFEKDKNGKPYIKNIKCNFNISHSGDYVVCAFNKDKQVGIDIEKIRPVKVSLLMHCCCHSEMRFILGDNLIPSNIIENKECLERFFKVWTFKEAFLKCSGVGIRQDIKSVVYVPQSCKHFDIDNYSITVLTEK